MATMFSSSAPHKDCGECVFDRFGKICLVGTSQLNGAVVDMEINRQELHMAMQGNGIRQEHCVHYCYDDEKHSAAILRLLVTVLQHAIDINFEIELRLQLQGVRNGKFMKQIVSLLSENNVKNHYLALHLEGVDGRMVLLRLQRTPVAR